METTFRKIAEELVEAYKSVDFVRYKNEFKHPSVGEVVEHARKALAQPDKRVIGNGMHRSRQGELG